MGELLDFESPPNPSIVRQLSRLSDRYRVYCRTITPVWTPGVVITAEMRNQAESHLPLAEFTAQLLAILCRLCCFPPKPVPLLCPFPLSWPDLLARLPFHLQQADPCRLLFRLLAGPDALLPLLFAFYIPRRFGGGFGRYPGQMAALREWLTTEAATGRHLRCLDAACGSGEGTWELALAARAAGIPREHLTIHGSSLGVLELTAASNLFFPHDLPHQKSMRQLFSPLATDGYAQRLKFFRDDLLNPSPVETPYDLILCNGTIGGPFIHEARQLEAALRGLMGRLGTGGMLCMADRFHGGWEKKIPRERIAAALGEMGLSVQVSEYGIAAVKCP